jgi:hypothetical protein
MISFRFSIRNPWRDKFENLWSRVYNTPIAYKFIEIEVYKETSIIAFGLDLTTRQSHAGLDIEAGVLGYCLHFNFYDSRHWDYKNKCWHIYT